jgi:hypothetical protein
MFWQSWTLFYGYDISAGPTTLNCGWFWYLTVDFQCFLLVPIILMCAMINKWLGIMCSVSILVASITYGMWQSMSVPIYGTLSDPNFMGKYYFNPLARACVYFWGTTVALMTLPSDKPAPKLQVTTDRPDQATPKVIVGAGTDYEVRPTETEHSKISKTKRVSAAKSKIFLDWRNLLGDRSCEFLYSSLLLPNGAGANPGAVAIYECSVHDLWENHFCH